MIFPKQKEYEISLFSSPLTKPVTLPWESYTLNSAEFPSPAAMKLSGIGLTFISSAFKEITPTVMREVYVEVPTVRWSDVGGLEEIKRRLTAFSLFLLRDFFFLGEMRSSLIETFKYCFNQCFYWGEKHVSTSRVQVSQLRSYFQDQG